MKGNQKLKVAFIILLIILISLISFGGMFIQKGNRIENIVPEYQLGRDLKGSRVIGISVSKANSTVIYDKDGNVVTEESENTIIKEEPVNSKELLTKENYQKAKEIFEKRLNLMQVTDYTIRLDETDGKAIIQLPENSDTDMIAQYTAIKGTFQVVGEGNNVLLTNNNIENAQWGYNTDKNGTTVYLMIKFNKEGTEILKNITNTYIKTLDEEGKEQTKTVTFKIDDSTLLSTYFDQEISNGVIQFSIGQATNSDNDLSSYVKEASTLAVLLNTGSLPLTYTIEENRYVMSDITEDMLIIPATVVLVIWAIGILYLIIRYGKNGLLGVFSFIGYIAILLLIIRYTNVIITLEGIFGIVITIIINYIFIVYLLHLLKNKEIQTIEEKAKAFKEGFVKTLLILIPVVITFLVLCFSGWSPIVSFGMIMFWGTLISILYNLIITRFLVVKNTKK